MGRGDNRDLRGPEDSLVLNRSSGNFPSHQFAYNYFGGGMAGSCLYTKPISRKVVNKNYMSGMF